MSHTVTVEIEFRDRPAFERACGIVNAKIGTEGEHKLYSSRHNGLAVTLPGWQYPIIVTASGHVAYDNFNGSWGNERELENLKEAYAIEVSKGVCDQLGWYNEQQQDGSLLVFHPDGGTITIAKGGKIDASGFTGTNCAVATAPLESALGSTSDSNKKIEYCALAQTVSESEI